ncbi:hypothetical protein RND71_004311 [Anisodus tanguticus]|uniref:Uncharacterized protein n=1 Tax=Anisodus tanguticus TaxID=243964 RepID=A0AAE1SXF0_9SOLA|nr:hypothetical protein RND71_004311 [Anisodus tanguticus]
MTENDKHSRCLTKSLRENKTIKKSTCAPNWNMKNAVVGHRSENGEVIRKQRKKERKEQTNG